MSLAHRPPRRQERMIRKSVKRFSGKIMRKTRTYSLQTPFFIRPLFTVSAASKVATGLLTTL
jgi:hypothetical protein